MRYKQFKCRFTISIYLFLNQILNTMTNSPSRDEKVVNEEDLFYFESDHLALRENRDYSEVLKNLLILCAQRKKSIENYNKVVELKKEALASPGKVLDKISKGESLGVPDMLRVPELPIIDWKKYDSDLPESLFKEIYEADEIYSKKKQENSPFKEPKPTNRRWTNEEQKRLEELLQIHPPEPIELRRFKKIADALGNRTVQQVSSRVQKYFLKLYNAGLPIPGRIPKSAEKYRKGLQHKHQRNNHYLFKPTTFFPDLCVPVVMTELDDAPGPSNAIAGLAPIPENNSGTNLNYLIPSAYHEGNAIYNGANCAEKSETEMQIELLKRIRRVKLKEQSRESSRSQYHHFGYRCDYCGDEPIIGTRWHCITCKTDSIDYCTDCALAQMYSENSHDIRHRLVYFNETDGDGSESSEDEEEMKQSVEISDSSSDSCEDEESEEDSLASDTKIPKNIPNSDHFEHFDFDNILDGFAESYPTGSDLFDDIDNNCKD